MEENINSGVLPDLRDLESKLGLKTPESLLKSMKEDCACDERAQDTDETLAMLYPEGLSIKLKNLKHQMEHLRSTDVSILRQLLSLHEGMEMLRWDRSNITSLTGSLAGSQSSLPEVTSVIQAPGGDAVSCSQITSPEKSHTSSLAPSGVVGLSTSVVSCEISPEPWSKVSLPKQGIAHKGNLDPNISDSAQNPKYPLLGLQELNALSHTNEDWINSGDFPAETNNLVEQETELSLCQSEALLGYDTHWCWVESKDDVTFL